MSVINFPILYIPDPLKGSPLFAGKLFVGEPGLDPEIVGNQKLLSVVQEDGNIVSVPQPFILSAGGVPVYNGSPVRLDVEGNYSIKILNNLGAQIYFIENVFVEQTVSDLSKDYTFPTAAAYKAFNEDFPDGKYIIIQEFSTGNGGGATYIKESGTVSANDVNKIASDVFSSTIVRVESANITPHLAWVFDDAHDSAGPDGVLKTLFDARGYKYGLAIPGANLLSGGSKLDFNEAKEMQEAGFEIINHGFTGDAPNGISYGVLKFIGEAQSTWSQLNRIGINAVGYQTPNSVLNDVYKESASGIFSYAFTVAASSSPMQKGVGRYDLFRLGIEALTEQQCIDAVDDLIRFGGTLIDFAHDIILDDVNYDKIVAVLDRINELGFGDISVGVSEAIRNVVDFKEPLLKWYLDDLISNNPNDYVEAVGGTITSVTVTNVSDVNITITNGVLTRIEKDITLPEGTVKGDLMTFCSTLRSISGTFGVNSVIGIELKDSGDSILDSKEIEGIDLNTNTARYPISIAQATGAVIATVYMLIDSDSAGAVALMRNPLLRFGTDVSPEAFIASGDSVIGVLTDTIPSQTITAGASSVDVTLNNTSDNGRYSITSNKLTMTSNWEGGLDGSVLGGIQTTSGGRVEWLIAGVTGGGSGGTIGISPVTDSPDGPAGCSHISSHFKIGQTAVLKVRAITNDFSISSATSRVTSF